MEEQSQQPNESNPLIKLICDDKGNSVYSVAFSSDGNMIVSGSEDETICLWDIKGNSVPQRLHYHTDTVHSVAFSPG